jgi:hypothetical protein
MTIKELIEELQKHPNQDAKITVRANPINAECEEYDEELRHIEIWGIDTKAEEIEIFATIENWQIDNL